MPDRRRVIKRPLKISNNVMEKCGKYNAKRANESIRAKPPKGLSLLISGFSGHLPRQKNQEGAGARMIFSSNGLLQSCRSHRFWEPPMKLSLSHPVLTALDTDEDILVMTSPSARKKMRAQNRKSGSHACVMSSYLSLVFSSSESEAPTVYKQSSPAPSVCTRACMGVRN
ncbi:hypothetical protein SAMD00023353_0105400 [Rosellinia necatrix]|uniref:Uncharacterized protein n=1 Tax=Rosellinia necatrix TaxID=77044 RepID=A0A1S7UIE3_ROSNE|nr:hypothetical protein SAMD00023353_0105400 [Rosellinia necatrix]